MAICLLALGSNLGDRQHHLRTAIEQIGGYPTIEIVAESRWHETQPAGGPGGQDPFLNGAVLVQTQLSAEQLLQVTQSVEQRIGRTREVHWGPRCVDVDLLIYDDLVCQTEELSIPHPWMVARRFVVEPAAEIASQMLHPVLGWTLDRLQRHLRDTPNRMAVVGVAGRNFVRRVCQQASATWIADPRGSAEAERHHGAAVPDCRQQIELAERRWQCLSDSNWFHGDACAISDFWLAESVVTARSTLSAEDVGRVESRVNQLAANLPKPKLLILCPATEPLTGAVLDWAGFSAYLRRQNEFPWLEIPVTREDRIIDQIAAAFASMQ